MSDYFNNGPAVPSNPPNLCPPEQAARAYPEHSCYEWNRQVYTSSPEYTASECGTCGRITGFKWRSPWRRFVGLFTSEPTLRKEIKFALREWWWKVRR